MLCSRVKEKKKVKAIRNCCVMNIETLEAAFCKADCSSWTDKRTA